MRTIEFTPNPNTDAHAAAFLHGPITEMANHRTTRPCVVVLPGGGYNFCSMREAEPVALEYLTAGFNVVLLDKYSLKEQARDFNPLCDVGFTIMKIRENAEDWGCDPEKIAVLGFSAGGHLAGTAGTMWNDPRLVEKLGVKNGENRPNAMVLCYAVISSDKKTKSHTIRWASGEAEPGSPEDNDWFVDRHVDETTCPAFIWHTVTDNSVPIENTIRMLSALQAKKIPYECHLFPEGPHGLSVCTREVGKPDPYTGRWVEMSKMWLYKIFDFEK